MAIIVRHRETNEVYALIGTGYGAYKAARPSFFGGNLFPHEEEGEIPVAAVSNENGDIQWFYTEDLQVIEIDGIKLKELLAPYVGPQNVEESVQSICPACQSKLSPDCQECPSCGLVFPE